MQLFRGLLFLTVIFGTNAVETVRPFYTSETSCPPPQDPMRGGTDQMFEDLVATIHAGDEDALAKDAMAPPRKRMVPEIMLKLARAVSPF